MEGRGWRGKSRESRWKFSPTVCLTGDEQVGNLLHGVIGDVSKSAYRVPRPPKSEPGHRERYPQHSWFDAA
jgi:hypothetical protein